MIKPTNACFQIVNSAMKEKDRQGAGGAGREAESRLGLWERQLQDGPSGWAGPSVQTSVHTSQGHPRHGGPIYQPPLAEALVMEEGKTWGSRH